MYASGGRLYKKKEEGEKGKTRLTL
jgi:hypothetical protein